MNHRSQAEREADERRERIADMRADQRIARERDEGRHLKPARDDDRNGAEK